MKYSRMTPLKDINKPFRRMRRESLPEVPDTEGEGLFNPWVLTPGCTLLFSWSVSVPHQLLFDGRG